MFKLNSTQETVADPGGQKGHAPGPVKISHKKDGCRIWSHRFHVSRPPLYPVAGSATEKYIPSDSQETILQMYTHVFSLEAKMLEILTDLNWK